MQLEVFFDYTCPYCYLGLHELTQILPGYPDLSVRWCPCELHMRPEPVPSHWEDSSEWLSELKERLENAGLPLNRPLEPGNYTDLAIHGLFSLVEQGADIGQYNEAVYAAVFQDGKNIEDIDVLSDCAALAGGDVPAFRQSLNSAEYSEKRLMLDKYGWKENALEAVPSLRIENAFLNAVPGVGLVRQQMIKFLDAESGSKEADSTKTIETEETAKGEY